ncbi:MAG: hypothetical protein AAF585_10750 [Verrucomicrobiota bacterium]
MIRLKIGIEVVQAFLKTQAPVKVGSFEIAPAKIFFKDKAIGLPVKGKIVGVEAEVQFVRLANEELVFRVRAESKRKILGALVTPIANFILTLLVGKLDDSRWPIEVSDPEDPEPIPKPKRRLFSRKKTGKRGKDRKGSIAIKLSKEYRKSLSIKSFQITEQYALIELESKNPS